MDYQVATLIHYFRYQMQNVYPRNCVDVNVDVDKADDASFMGELSQGDMTSADWGGGLGALAIAPARLESCEWSI